MPAPVAGIHVLTGIHVLKASAIKDVHGRNKSGHDEGVSHEHPAVRSLIEADTGIQDARGHTGRMANSDERPVMEPFPDKTGTGWHVVIRYREGHERLIDGFATKAEAVDWIEANAGQVKE